MIKIKSYIRPSMSPGLQKKQTEMKEEVGYAKIIAELIYIIKPFSEYIFTNNITYDEFYDDWEIYIRRNRKLTVMFINPKCTRSGNVTFVFELQNDGIKNIPILDSWEYNTITLEVLEYFKISLNKIKGNKCKI